MTLLLSLLCVLTALFAGGCALVAVGVGALPLAAIPAGIAALNVLVILGANRRGKPAVAAFATLASLDLVVAVAILWALAASASAFGGADGRNEPVLLGALGLGCGILIKGVLTVGVALRLRRAGAGSGEDGGALGGGFAAVPRPYNPAESDEPSS